MSSENICTCITHVKVLSAGRPIESSGICECSMKRSSDSGLGLVINQYDDVDDAYARTVTGDTDDVILLDTCSSVDRHCQCHTRHAEKLTKLTNKHAVNKLMMISIVSFVFMAGEFIGGYLSGSLAIMTDAAHLLSDLTGFIISMIALWVARKPVTMRLTFGYFRAEILGAVTSVLIIWALTIVLVYLAINRVIHPDYEIDADVMLITAGCGVFINIVLIAILQFTGQGHSHSHSLSSGGHSHDKKHKKNGSKNLNIQAAFIHCIGDLLQSVGVFVAAVIIKVKPEYKLADPICTFLFSVIVLFTTMSILKEAFLVLMEAIPSNVNYTTVKDELESISGVCMVHSLHIWALTTTSSAMMVHLAVGPHADSRDILSKATHLANSKFGFSFTTIQVEDYDEETMSSCRRCIALS